VSASRGPFSQASEASWTAAPSTVPRRIWLWPSSTRVTRLMVVSEPPSIDANEITDKGYLNQRAVIERRAALVEKLHSGAEKILTS